MRLVPCAAMFFTVLAGLLIRADHSGNEAQKRPASSWTISTDRFSLVTEGKQSFILPHSVGKSQRIRVPKEWLISPREEKDEVESPVSSIRFDRQVTSFPIGNGKIGVQLSSFEIMPEGSIQGAAGRDVFLIYDPATNALSKGLVVLGITKDRYRSFGCFSGRMTHFLISDTNRDGLVDIGTVKEEISCPDGDDRLETRCTYNTESSGTFTLQEVGCATLKNRAGPTAMRTPADQHG